MANLFNFVGASAADFVPELLDRGSQPDSGAYIPFGAGPRIYMGQQNLLQKSLIESGYIVARMVQEFSAIESVMIGSGWAIGS
ncbi:cytochrome P450 protein [Rutstroemia sp. NJR-2017a WRK4]|nr:cytochrome P450 protein [Rutstroemia sp. NJR-2017a WRK4]